MNVTVPKSGGSCESGAIPRLNVRRYLYRSPGADRGDPAIPDQDHAIPDGILRRTRLYGASHQSGRRFRGEAGLEAIETADKKRKSKHAGENMQLDSHADIYLPTCIWLARPEQFWDYCVDAVRHAACHLARIAARSTSSPRR